MRYAGIGNVRILRAKEALESVGLGDRNPIINRPELSGGHQQRPWAIAARIGQRPVHYHG